MVSITVEVNVRQGQIIIVFWSLAISKLLINKMFKPNEKFNTLLETHGFIINFAKFKISVYIPDGLCEDVES